MIASPAPRRSPSLTTRIRKKVGFTKSYNFLLWVVFGGTLFGFSLARLKHLDVDNQFCGPNEGAAPGECYYYKSVPRYRIGFFLHLAGILPASILAVFEFIPAIRARWIIVHRVFGYMSMALYLVGLAGALMIARRAFGGGVDAQAWVAFVGFGVLACFALSLYNVKKLQIEQHRAWMLRGWFYAGSIITARLLMVIIAKLTSDRDYHLVWSCAKIASTLTDQSLLQDYPSCASYADGSNLAQLSPVSLDLGGSNANVGAALDVSFGAALWLAFNIHALGIEIYLRLTPREAERLRTVSYARQRQAGMQNLGSAGLTADRLGDAQGWAPRKRDSQGPAKIESAVLSGVVAEPSLETPQ